MEELLPLIIGILWLAYTFYTKGQKKKSAREARPGGQPEKKPTFLEQLLAAEGLHVESHQPVYEEEEDVFDTYEEPAPPLMMPKKDKTSPFLDAELSRYEEEGQAQFKEAFALEDEEDKMGYFRPSELTLQMQDFDLKKAVVFSAVLDAPYIDYK